MKKCAVCNLEKEVECFHKSRRYSDGLDRRCKECKKEYDKENYLNRKDEKINLIEIWQLNNRDKYLTHRKNWNERNHAKRCEMNKKRYHEDINVKLASLLRSRLNAALKKNIKIGSAVQNLGCSLEHFKKWIESMFKPGMTWENHGRTGWHLDHVIPLNQFDLTDPKQFLKAVHYMNLQPLWAYENLTKPKGKRRK